MKCQYCESPCVKNGKQKNGTQKYRCKGCNKYQQEVYKYQAKILFKRGLITRLVVENAGFRGIARALGISVNTVYVTVMKTAAQLQAPPLPFGGSYEVDEMKVYEHLWVAYAVERKSGLVAGITVGRRNKATLRRTINAVLMASPAKIYTDGLIGYRSLVPSHLHRVTKSMLCKVERLHLTARNRVKMLNRDTLAVARKPATVLACLKLLFWNTKVVK